MTNHQKGKMEMAISESYIKLQREILGRGPQETKTYIIRDMVIIRMKGVPSGWGNRMGTTGFPLYGTFYAEKRQGAALDTICQGRWKGMGDIGVILLTVGLFLLFWLFADFGEKA